MGIQGSCSKLKWPSTTKVEQNWTYKLSSFKDALNPDGIPLSKGFSSFNRALSQNYRKDSQSKRFVTQNRMIEHLGVVRVRSVDFLQVRHLAQGGTSNTDSNV